MKETKFYICEKCGNIVEKHENSGVPLVCCGQKMSELVPGTVEASREKHIPVITVEGNLVKVTVGSVLHPMAAEHNIGWVYLETDKGTQKKYLEVGAEPTVVFALAEGESAIAAYAWCNLHGLWKAEV